MYELYSLKQMALVSDNKLDHQQNQPTKDMLSLSRYRTWPILQMILPQPEKIIETHNSMRYAPQQSLVEIMYQISIQ